MLCIKKKKKYVLTPGEPGSEKYLLEEGVRTFDMKGVDYFPEGKSIEINSDDDIIKGTSKGATYYKSSDGNITNLDSPDSSGRRKSNKIYGPRTKNKELYSVRFKKEMDKRKTKQGDLGDDGNNLVDVYWEQFKQGDHKRKNKRNRQRQIANKSPVKEIPGSSSVGNLDCYQHPNEDEEDLTIIKETNDDGTEFVYSVHHQTAEIKNEGDWAEWISDNDYDSDNFIIIFMFTLFKLFTIHIHKILTIIS
jgi:hypothetical protein